MDKYQHWDSNGLLNAHPNEKFGENSFLYAFEYGIIQNLLDKNKSPTEFCDKALVRMSKGNGMYLQNPNNFDMMSHDQLTAIFGCLYIKNDQERMDQIIRFILRSNFKYDGNWLHPRDFIFYSFLAGKLYGYLLFPLLIPMFLVAMFLSHKDRTNGKILWFVRGMIIKNRTWKKFYYKLMSLILRLIYGNDAIYKIFTKYFPNYVVNMTSSSHYDSTEEYRVYVHPICLLMYKLKGSGIDG